MHRWIGHVLDVRASASVVEVFHKGQPIAAHPRSHTKLFSTLPEHMPSSHRQHREWSPGRFLNWAGQIGPATGEVVFAHRRRAVGAVHGTGCALAASIACELGAGRGIEAGTQEHVFEPFFTTKGKGKGTGMGLAVVAAMVSLAYLAYQLMRWILDAGPLDVTSDFDFGTNMLTITLPVTITADVLTLVLDFTITDMEGLALDGEIFDPSVGTIQTSLLKSLSECE